jgi:anaerobic selenocysteine-containing dehydrogenase
MVGATVEVEGGIRIRHRPVKTMSIRGIGGHKNGYHTVYLVGLLTQVLGAADAYGGSHIGLGVDLRYREDLPTIATSPVKDFNGFPTNKGKWVVPFGRFPLPEVKSPHQRDLHDLFLMQFDTPMYGISNREEILQKAKLDPKIEVVINYGCDSLISIANPRDSAKFFKTVPFMVDFELWGTELNEGFADIVLPDTCSLEYSDWGPLVGGFFGQTTQLAEPWTFQTTNRVVEPQYSRRYVMDVTLDILDRMGLRAKTNEYLNAFIGFGDTLKLKPTDKLNWEELGDRVVRHYFGDEHNWEWFKKHGFISWPKKPEDFYSGCFSNIRIQVYREFMIDLGKNIKKVASELGIEMDWKQYIPGPDWFPCPPHEVKDPRYDLYCFAYRDPLHMDACTMEQPWLDECSKINPYTYNITMSAEMCQEKGLKEGDTIELESDKGNKVQGVLHLRKGQHPQAVAIMGTAGHFAFGQPIARGKGVSFVSLMENRWEDCDPIVFNLELCVKVKVTKIK